MGPPAVGRYRERQRALAGAKQSFAEAGRKQRLGPERPSRRDSKTSWFRAQPPLARSVTPAYAVAIAFLLTSLFRRRIPVPRARSARGRASRRRTRRNRGGGRGRRPSTVVCP